MLAKIAAIGTYVEPDPVGGCQINESVNKFTPATSESLQKLPVIAGFSGKTGDLTLSGLPIWQFYFRFTSGNFRFFHAKMAAAPPQRSSSAPAVVWTYADSLALSLPASSARAVQKNGNRLCGSREVSSTCPRSS